MSLSPPGYLQSPPNPEVSHPQGPGDIVPVPSALALSPHCPVPARCPCTSGLSLSPTCPCPPRTVPVPSGSPLPSKISAPPPGTTGPALGAGPPQGVAYRGGAKTGAESYTEAGSRIRGGAQWLWAWLRCCRAATSGAPAVPQTSLPLPRRAGSAASLAAMASRLLRVSAALRLLPAASARAAPARQLGVPGERGRECGERGGQRGGAGGAGRGVVWSVCSPGVTEPRREPGQR